MTRGDERTLNIVVTNPNGTPVNLAGKRLTFTVRTNGAFPTVIFQKITGNGIVSLDPPSGLASATINPADTSALSENNVLTWTLKLDNNPDSPVTLLSGTLEVLANPQFTIRK